MAACRQSGGATAVGKFDPEVQERLRTMAAELRQLMYGEQGCPEWGTLFRDIERDGLGVGTELARLVMEQTTAAQAKAMPAEALALPDDVVQPAGTQTTPLETSAGLIQWEQPCGYLKTGRKAFSPSQEGSGAGR